jgi:hypothetical protein
LRTWWLLRLLRLLWLYLLRVARHLLHHHLLLLLLSSAHPAQQGVVRRKKERERYDPAREKGNGLGWPPWRYTRSERP